MKKCIAKWLLRLARRLDSGMKIPELDGFEAKRLGIGYHLSKADVRKYRAEHPELTSHRKGLEALIQDTKGVIVGSITRGLYDNRCIDFHVRKTLFTADVTGTLNVYVPVGTEIESTAHGSEEGEGR